MKAQRRRPIKQQSRIQQLEYQLSRLEKQVATTEELLAQTRTTQKKSFNELNLLRQQIELRTELLNQLTLQIGYIDAEISRLNDLIRAFEKDIFHFQVNYGKAAYISYKVQNELSILLWILGSRTFKQAYNRIVYFREFSKYRKNQIFLIKRTKKYLLQKKKEKQEKRKNKEILLQKRQTEKSKLDATRQEKDRLYEELRKTELAYQLKISAYRKELAIIREKIKELVLESQKDSDNSEKSDKLSSIFANNRGKLPWPIPKQEGVITGYFGKNITETGNEIINDGIYISTKRGQQVRAIFSGKVSLVSRVPFYGTVVIIQHGNYRSVYANLENVMVHKDQEVNILQPIGYVQTNTATGDTQLYFQIYRDYNPVNPLYWISNKY
ncbi:MAG: peptidoglycan DD-metalloendopeptidase family protein [Bacteroidia bacterium]|nr:peptidoglycan DD-metalloendopeptidase family protein [Bacteroidia bacterium]MDW8157626.1 peptidoglycan DD-metalloendopeptidase family protein [Bacteroidia bacterium]